MAISRSFLFAVSIALCCAGGNSAGIENRKLWNDRVDHEQFVKELRARKIPFRVDAQGVIWYAAADVATVDEITAKILAQDDAYSAYSFEDAGDMRLFLQRLNDAGIPYKTKRRLGRDWVLWDKKDDQRVTPIQEAVEDKGTQRARQRGR